MRTLTLRLCLASLLLAGGALAQERTGRIEGTVYDDDGNPMAGARVTASSPTQIGGVKVATTGGDGSFRFLSLIPGKFTVRVSRKGFRTDIRQGIRVNANKTVTLDILLERAPDAKPPRVPASRPVEEPGIAITPSGRKPAAGKPRTETYVITAARPVVDVTKATTGESLSDEYVESVPVQSRSFQGVAGMTRSVTQRRNPKGYGAGNPSVSGGAYFNNTYLVDGMETTDPVTHTFAANFNFDAISDVNIMTGGSGAEYSDTAGGVVNMVTKSGSNKFELDSSLYYRDDALTIKDQDEQDLTFRDLQFNVNVGGPIVRDKLWYFTSFELNDRVSTIPSDPNHLLPDPAPRRFLSFYWLGKLTWQPHPRHRIVGWVQTDPALISNAEQLITKVPDAEYHQDQYGTRATAAWEWLATDKLFVKTQLGFGWNRLRISPERGDETTPQVRDNGTGVWRDNYWRLVTDDRYRASVQADATYFLDHAGKHEIKGGFRFKHEANPSTEGRPGNAILFTQFGNPQSLRRYFVDFDDKSLCDRNSPSYDPKECKQGSLSTSVSGNRFILFLQDRWRLPRYKRLTLIPGVALHAAETINPEGERVTSFVTATGHLNFAWDLFDNGKTVLRGGYNQYVDMGFLALASFIGQDLIEYTCDYDPNTGEYNVNCRIGGQTRTVGRPEGPEFDSDGKVIPGSKFNPGALTVPRVHELTFGAEREWLTGFSTGLDLQWRRYTNQWEDLETNVIWNEAGDNSQAFKSGKSEFIYDLETPDEAQRRYVSMSLFARKFSGNWQVMGSYTWSRNEGTVAEGYATTYLDRARQAQFFEGFMPDDRRHVFKVGGWYRLPWDVTIGGNLWVGTGTPYDKLYFNAFFNDYEDRRAPRGYDPRDLSTPDDDEELRMPTQLALDLKVTYKLERLTRWIIGAPINLELIGEVFNMFNLRTATEYEDRYLKPGAATQWGDIINKQDPFRVRFGLRYRY